MPRSASFHMSVLASFSFPPLVVSSMVTGFAGLSGDSAGNLPMSPSMWL